MRTAIIINKTVPINAIVLDEENGDAVLASYGTKAVEVTGMEPMPGIGTGWKYVKGEWVAPDEPQN